jgi:hypothetical protein
MRFAFAGILFIIAAFHPGAVRGGEAASHARVDDALASGEYRVSLRYRAEWVNDDNAALSDKNGYASTVRTTLSYHSGTCRHARAFLEFEDVTDLGLDDEHRNGASGHLSNGVSGRPVVADVNATEINQGYLTFDGIPRVEVKGGRMELALDDERFVGPVGWRQNHQSFDASVLTLNAAPRAKISYLFLRQVNRIFGDRQKMKSHLVNASLDLEEAGRLAPYLYLLDYDEASLAGLSTLTVGASWTGEFGDGAGESVAFPCRLEFAWQTDAGENPADVEALYLRAELAARRGRSKVRMGLEVLEGSAGEGQFSTPLATLHKWNGWADKFLVTPANGLEDFYLGTGAVAGLFDCELVGHGFKATATSSYYGGELDGVVKVKTRWKQTVAVKAAWYDASDYSFDTFKMMAWTSYGF